MNAEECIGKIRNDVQATLNDVSVIDGFTDGPKPAGKVLTTILSILNDAYIEAVEEGFMSCYKTYTLTPNCKEFELDGTTGIIEEVRLLDTDGSELWILKEMSKTSMNVMTPYHNRNTPGRPLQYYTLGELMGFDRAPNLAFKVKILGDTLPETLANRTDVPARIPVVAHRKVCDIASYKLGLALIRAQTNQGADQSGYARLSGLRDKSKDAKSYLRRLATSRSISTNHTPNMIDMYRM